MSELKLNAGIFWILENGKEKRIFDSEKNAVSALKGVIAASKEDDEKVVIMEVNTTESKWSIQQVPWEKIAKELMRA